MCSPNGTAVLKGLRVARNVVGHSSHHILLLFLRVVAIIAAAVAIPAPAGAQFGILRQAVQGVPYNSRAAVGRATSVRRCTRVGAHRQVCTGTRLTPTWYNYSISAAFAGTLLVKLCCTREIVKAAFESVERT